MLDVPVGVDTLVEIQVSCQLLQVSVIHLGYTCSIEEQNLWRTDTVNGSDMVIQIRFGFYCCKMLIKIKIDKCDLSPVK